MPTASSLAVCTLGVVVAIFFVVLPRLGADVFLKLLLGTETNFDLIASSKDDYAPVFQQLLSNDLVGRAVVFGAWMFIGLCAFIILMSLVTVIGTVEEEKRELGYLHQQKASLLRNHLVTLAFKIIVAAIWAAFAAVCLRFVLSFFRGNRLSGLERG